MDRMIKTLLTAKLNKSICIALVFIKVATPLELSASERKLTFVVPGVVKEIFVKVGQKVAMGTPMARLDTLVFSAKKRMAEATLKTANLKYDIARERMNNMQQLYNDISISKEELQKSLVAVSEAKTNLENAEAGFKIAKWSMEQAILIAPMAGTVKQVDGYVGLVVNTHCDFPTVVTLE